MIILGCFSWLLLILYISDVLFPITCGSKENQKLFWETLRDRSFQKLKRCKRYYAQVTFANEALQVFFALNDYGLYIFLFPDKETTLKETVQKLPEADTQRCSVKKMFLEISQNSLESTCARVSLLIKLYFINSVCY